ncbi:hypothetical protein HZH66_011804 [Vespula vulgaris]|uniref:Secreted protein n=1 Tax=Vespula vulgaris TaxID=7454 RepID=A0A834JF21_VESVU|nr:hypothetical protein HZH66_011804 [Vespula vulgaris]
MLVVVMVMFGSGGSDGDGGGGDGNGSGGSGSGGGVARRDRNCRQYGCEFSEATFFSLVPGATISAVIFCRNHPSPSDSPGAKPSLSKAAAAAAAPLKR